MSAGDWKKMLEGAQTGNLRLVKYYLELGVNPNYQHPEFLTTPLIESITHQYPEIVAYLLNNGADPQLKAGFSEETPLMIAEQTQNESIVKLLQMYLPQENPYKRLVKRWISKLLKPLLRRYQI